MKIIGVVSMLPGEGKTFMAANFAQLAAASGRRVLLVDAATCSGRLSRLLAPEAKAGLSDVLRENVSLSDVLWDFSDANLKILPLGNRHRPDLDSSSDSSEIQHVLTHAATLFDLVVVDLPPATLVADVREMASGFDGFLLITEWGKTRLDVIESALASNDQLRLKLLGVILNKVDIGKLRTYDPSLASFYDQSKYSTYVSNVDEKVISPALGKAYRKSGKQR
jgi:succinoglycan biosynthesis transport protein ExoP